MHKLVLTVVAGLGLSFAAMAEDWPVWRGVNHDSISMEKGLKPSSKIVWKKNVGVGYSSVSVCKGKLLTAGNSGNKDTIYCLNPKTGKELWKYSYSCPKGSYPGPRATPVTDGSKVWMLSRNGDLICLNLANGKKIWSKKVLSSGARNLRWGLASSPMIIGDLVVVNVGANGMAFNKNSGKKAWANSGGAGSYATPMPFKYNGKQYVALFTGNSLIIANAATGRKITSTAWASKYDINAADPVISADGKYIFASSGYNTGRGALLKFNGKNLSKVWGNRDLCSQFASPVLYKGVLYGVNGNNGSKKSICALDFKTGKKKWRGTLRFGSLMIAGNMLIYLEENGKLNFLKINPAKEQIIKSVQVLKGGKSWTMPVVANGMLYCRNSKGNLVCLSLK
jgi:outer membrane protein assembly factor BamB